jgi:hypothetical protein
MTLHETGKYFELNFVPKPSRHDGTQLPSLDYLF